MNPFNSWDDIESFLTEHQDTIESANNFEVGNYIIPIFASPITNNPEVMMKFHAWLDRHVSTDLRFVIEHHRESLVDADLNDYKFKIMLGIRGPIDRDILLEFVKANITNDDLLEITKHKDFPEEIKEVLYELTNDESYLSAEAKDIFLF